MRAIYQYASQKQSSNMAAAKSGGRRYSGFATPLLLVICRTTRKIASMVHSACAALPDDGEAISLVHSNAAVSTSYHEPGMTEVRKVSIGNVKHSGMVKYRTRGD
jgi:hypothetical protein